MADYDRPISLRLPTSVLTELDRRVTRRTEDADREWTRGQALRAAVGRYYEICRRELASLDLSRGELALVCDVLNVGLLDFDGDDRAPSRLSIVWAVIADSLRQRPGTRHGVGDAQSAELVAKLRTASYAQLVALVDFVERFWADDETTEQAAAPSEGA